MLSVKHNIMLDDPNLIERLRFAYQRLLADSSPSVPITSLCFDVGLSNSCCIFGDMILHHVQILRKIIQRPIYQSIKIFFKGVKVFQVNSDLLSTNLHTGDREKASVLAPVTHKLTIHLLLLLITM